MVAPESYREEHIDLSSGEWPLWMRPIAATRQVARHNKLHPGPIGPLWPTRRNRLARGTPEHRRQAEGLEGPDGKQVRVEGARDDGHHCDERIDDDSILDQERGREEEEGGVKGAFVRTYTPRYTKRRTDARTTFSPPTTMLAIIMSLIGLHAPVPRPARWRYPLSFGSTLGRRQLATDLLEDLVIRFEVFGEEVRGGIGRPGGSL